MVLGLHVYMFQIIFILIWYWVDDIALIADINV